MSASLVERIPVDEQLQSLTDLVGRLQREVCELRDQNAELRQQVRSLRCDAGYWKSRHTCAVERNKKLQTELDQAKAEIRQLKAERFGKQSEKQSSTDRSNELDGPREQSTAKKKRGQQPGRPAPKRRDYSHLPAREEQSDLPEDEKVCECCGKWGQHEICRHFRYDSGRRLTWDEDVGCSWTDCDAARHGMFF